MEYTFTCYIDNNGSIKRNYYGLVRYMLKGLKYKLCNITQNLLDKLSKKKTKRNEISK